MSKHTPLTSIKIGDGQIDICELAWPDALHLYNKLMAQSKALMDDKGQIVVDAQKIISAISENVELAEWLVLKTTGKSKEWLNERSLSEMLDITTESAVLNIGIIVGRIKNAGSRLRQVVAGANETPNMKPSA